MDFSELVEKKCFNIWRYANLYTELVGQEFRLSIEEGWTKEESFLNSNKTFHLPPFYLKREDLNPLGSFKTRGLAYQISRAWQNGKKEFCISSTGNAALAAAALCKKADFKLFIFLHKFPKLEIKRKNILKEIRSFQPQKIFFEKEPTRKSQEFAKKEGIYNLTPSIDEWSSEGLKSIGFEIFEKILSRPDNHEKSEKLSILSFSSSGTSIIGIGKSFNFLSEKGLLDNPPILYAVNQNKIKRAAQVEKIIKESKGRVLDVSQHDIKKAQDFFEHFKIRTSLEGISAFAGFLRLSEEENIGKALIILSGKKWNI